MHSTGSVIDTSSSEPSGSEIAAPLAVEIANATMPIRLAAPFSPVTVIVTDSLPEKVSGAHSNEMVPPAAIVVGDVVHEPDGG